MEVRLESPLVIKTWIGTPEKIEMVTIKAPTVRLMHALGHMPPGGYTMDQFRQIVSGCTGIKDAVLLEMEIYDYNKIANLVCKLILEGRNGGGLTSES